MTSMCRVRPPILDGDSSVRVRVNRGMGIVRGWGTWWSPASVCVCVCVCVGGGVIIMYGNAVIKDTINHCWHFQGILTIYTGTRTVRSSTITT